MSIATATTPTSTLSKELDADDIANGERSVAGTGSRRLSGNGATATTSNRPFSFNLRKILNRGGGKATDGGGGGAQKEQQQQQQQEVYDKTNGHQHSPKANNGISAVASSPAGSSSRSLVKGGNGALRSSAARTPQSPLKKDDARSISSPRSAHGGVADADGISLTLEETSVTGSTRTLGSILQSGGADHDGHSDDEEEEEESVSSPDKRSGRGGGGDGGLWDSGGDLSPGGPSVKSDRSVGGGLRPAWKNTVPPIPPALSGRMMASPTSPIADGDHLSEGGGTEDQGYWSDDTPSLASSEVVTCGTEKCIKERRRLMRLIDDLKQKADVSEEAQRKYMSEILDLRQQVAMLSGFGPGTSGEDNGQYISSYDVVSKEPSMNAKPAPFVGHRIKHQRINPSLIIKEKDIVIEKIVGVGSFGKVWKGVYDGRPVAIKTFYSEDADVIGEINLMERVNNKPHVLRLEGVYLSNDTGEEAQVALVTPFMENGSLYDVLVNTKAPQYMASVTMTNIVKIAMQTADGVRALHAENVIHRDLACRNILVDGDLDVYVSDFGFARQKENKSSKGFTKNNMGPVKWEAPESLQRKEYSEKTDAFSYAVCLYEMVSAKEPWEHETHAQVAYQVICGNRLPIALNCDPTLAELMQLCWEADPRKRPNFEYIHRRLKERYTQLQNEEREISGEKQLIYQLRQGTTFYKLPYLKGKPHKRQFKVSEDLRRLKWCFLPSRNFMQRARDPVRPATKQVFLTEVQDIRMGMRTANFRRIENVEKFRGRAAFSIITQDRTIDILCPTPEIMDQVVLGLRFLVDRLRPPPPAIPASGLDRFTLMARLRRGGFMLKFGQIGRPHERYFRVSANMKTLTWTSGETPGKGEHKTVDLTGIKDVRLFRHAQPGVAAVMPNLNLLSKSVDDLQFGFSLINQAGQADINLVAPNAFEYGIWTRGLELIVRNFQDEENMALATPTSVFGGDHAPPIYDRGDYLEFDGSGLGIGNLSPGTMNGPLNNLPSPPMKFKPMKGLPEDGDGGVNGVGDSSNGLLAARLTEDPFRSTGGGGAESDTSSVMSPHDALERSVTVLAGTGAASMAAKARSGTADSLSVGESGSSAALGVSGEGGATTTLKESTSKPSPAISNWSPLSQNSAYDQHAGVEEKGGGGGIIGGGAMMIAPSPQISYAGQENDGGVDDHPQDIYASGAAILQYLEEEKMKGNLS